MAYQDRHNGDWRVASDLGGAEEEIPRDSIPSRRHSWSRGAILAVTFLALLLARYIAGSLVWEDFTYSDNSHFTNGTPVGKDIPVQIVPGSGRFFPLGHQEFNLIRHVTSSVTGYQALRIVQLVLLCGILLVRDEELSIQARVALITLALITPTILISFSGLIYPEWNVVFWLICLAFSVKRFEQTQFIAWAVAAVISSQFMLYYKEIAFLLLLGFAVLRLGGSFYAAGKRIRQAGISTGSEIPKVAWTCAVPSWGCGFSSTTLRPCFQIIVWVTPMNFSCR